MNNRTTSILAGASLLAMTVGSHAASPYFGAYIPATTPEGNPTPWTLSTLFDYNPLKHTPIGDVPVIVPQLGDYTAAEYTAATNFVLSVAGVNPASHVPQHDYNTPAGKLGGWSLTTTDPRSWSGPEDLPFTAPTLATFIEWANSPNVLPLIGHSDFTPFGSSTLTPNSSLYAEPGPWAQVIGGISFEDLADHRIRVSSIDDRIDVVYTPPYGLTLKQAEQVCAQDAGAAGCRFNWKQAITGMPDGPNPFKLWNNGTPRPLTPADLPISDPPAGGGWTYEHELPGMTDNSYPFYYDYHADLSGHEQPNSLTWWDTPADPCLSGGLGAGTPYCGGGTAVGSMHFETKLVGMLTDANGLYTGHYVDFDTGVDWESDSNRSVVDVIQNGGTRSGGPFNIETFKSDPGNVYSDGTGGVTIDQVFETYGSMGQTPSVPELKTWIMVIIGFLGVGFVSSRQRYY